MDSWQHNIWKLYPSIHIHPSIHPSLGKANSEGEVISIFGPWNVNLFSARSLQCQTDLSISIILKKHYFIFLVFVIFFDAQINPISACWLSHVISSLLTCIFFQEHENWYKCSFPSHFFNLTAFFHQFSICVFELKCGIFLCYNWFHEKRSDAH